MEGSSDGEGSGHLHGHQGRAGGQEQEMSSARLDPCEDGLEVVAVWDVRVGMGWQRPPELSPALQRCLPNLIQPAGV